MSTHPFEREAAEGGDVRAGEEPMAVVVLDGSTGLVVVVSVAAGICDAAKTKEQSVGNTR